MAVPEKTWLKVTGDEPSFLLYNFGQCLHTVPPYSASIQCLHTVTLPVPWPDGKFTCRMISLFNKPFLGLPQAQGVGQIVTLPHDISENAAAFEQQSCFVNRACADCAKAGGVQNDCDSPQPTSDQQSRLTNPVIGWVGCNNDP